MHTVVNQTKLNPYSRSVSIIGVGCTPFMNTMDDPATEGLTEGELFGYAAMEAMKDAGVTPKDVDYYFHGCANPRGLDYITPNIMAANWVGMKGKGSIHHSEACCTGYLALEQAVNAVASGKYNVVLSGCVEFGDSLDIPYKPACFRRKMPMNEFLETTRWIYDKAYTLGMMAGPVINFDDSAEYYARTYGLSVQEMDEVICHMALNNRYNAVHHPLSISKKDFPEIAKEAGYDNVMDFMLSDKENPKMGEFLRVLGTEIKCDGAAAVIVCPTEMASQFTDKKPIEVLGIGSACLESSNHNLEIHATREAVRQVYELTGVKPEEIDLMYVNDFMIPSQLVSAEIAGYLPEGEGWKYISEGRTRFDGDKPLNTNGGRTSFGHAHAASGLADLYEAVHQMRGDCGEHQVKKLPKTTMLRGFGGSQNVTAAIIRTKED